MSATTYLYVSLVSRDQPAPNKTEPTMSFSTEYEALAFINAVYGCSEVKPVINRHTEKRIGYEGTGTFKNADALIVLSTEEDDDD